ncbi:TetR family transcriptional regulator [Chromobacterium amazonense]|uniref:TetR family transcriptional regulator n=1 Tax=Chromobacterium amazonense TaxID=1382803 RepID=UPI0021B7007F|nr:TetR family transcriptional regulator [Chromobacterium amazonense]MBM2882833.1 TetR family transcriptional regulator [Chromobacterium amazonense]
MASRKTADIREKELRLAVLRIEHGRSHTKARALTISSVAREAGVSAALIHNHYPTIAELIRVKQGASSRQQRDAKQAELLILKKRNADLHRELEDVRFQLAKLATINEMLVMDNATLRASRDTDKIVRIDSRKC